VEDIMTNGLSVCLMASLIALAGIPYPAGAAQIEKGSALAEKIEHRKKIQVLTASGEKTLVRPVVLAEGVVSLNLVGGYDPSEVIPWSDVRAIRVRKSGAGRGAFIGGGAGIALGLMTISLVGGTISAHGDTAKVLLYPGLIGLVCGAGLGASITSWKTVYAAPAGSRFLPQVSLIPSRKGGMMIRVSLSF
jgi:hypothetical protein